MITLGYWDIRALASPISILLEHLGKEYKFVSYAEVQKADGQWDRSAWTNVKCSLGFDFPNLPYFEDTENGGVKITESEAIIRYICNAYDPSLLGKTVQDKAAVDMVNSYLWDVKRTFAVIGYSPECETLLNTERCKLESRMILVANFLKRRREQGATYGVCSYPTFVDFILHEVCAGLVYMYADWWKNPELAPLKQLVDTVSANKGVQSFLAKPDNKEAPFCNHHARKWKIGAEGLLEV